MLAAPHKIKRTFEVEANVTCHAGKCSNFVSISPGPMIYNELQSGTAVELIHLQAINRVYHLRQPDGGRKQYGIVQATVATVFF